jgi:acylpyruvate hydrolase
MKLTTCEIPGRRGRRFIGALAGDGLWVDLSAVAAAARSRTPLPETMIEFLAGGSKTRAVAKAALRYVGERLRKEKPEAIRGVARARLVYRRKEIRLLAPVPRPGKIIHTAVNFGHHLKELTTWKAPEWRAQKWENFHYEHPTGFLQAPSAVVGTDARIIRPRFTKQLDYEIELAIIIGRRGRYIPQEEALRHVGGYCVFNDVSARDIQAREHANKVILLGKSFDSSAPLGPYLVTPDELDDPQNLDMEMRVNGQVRQKANTSEMRYKIRDLVSWWSNITLEPGDVITSGSPAGVAAGMDVPRWLEPGDRIEATIQGIGTLVNIVADDR